MRFEKSGTKGTKNRIIVVGRVRIYGSPLLAETGDESVPYSFCSQMAKVELERLSGKAPGRCSGASEVRLAATKVGRSGPFRQLGAPLDILLRTFQTVSPRTL